MSKWSRSKTHDDPMLGELVRARGWWRGRIDLGGAESVPLAVPGARDAPDPEALLLARRAADELTASADAVQAALDEHREPYTNGDDRSSDEQAASPSHVSVVRVDGRLALEIGYHVSWDDEHTLGALLRDGELIELNGSVLEP